MATTTTNKVNIMLSYADASSRTISFNNVRQEEILNISTRVQAINANMSEAFKTTFRSADNAPVTNIGKAQLVRTTEEMIYRAN